MSVCDGEVWVNQNALEQADRMAFIRSVASRGKNSGSIQKTIATKFRHVENISGLCKFWRIAPQNRMIVRIQTHVIFYIVS